MIEILVQLLSPLLNL